MRFIVSWLSMVLALTTVTGTDFAAYDPDTSGKTDVSAILQKAVNDAIASDKILRLEPGTYWVASPVTLTTNGLTVASTNPYRGSAVLRGSQVGAEQVGAEQEKAERQPIFLAKKPSYGLTLVGLSFVDAAAGVAGTPAMAVVHFRNCSFTDCAAGVTGDPIQIATFERCSFNRCGFGIRGRSPRKPARLNRSNLVNIYDCTFRACTDWAIQLEGSPVNVRDCDFEHNRAGVIELFDLYVGTIEGSYFEANGSEDSPPLIRLAPDQLPPAHNGQLALRGNQINVNGSPAIIEVVNGARLHAYDNRIAVKLGAGQTFVLTDGPDDHIRLDHNIVRDPAIP